MTPATPEAFSVALAQLDLAVRQGGDPTDALSVLDAILSGPAPSPAELRQLVDAVGGLAATWVHAAAPALQEAREKEDNPEASGLAAILADTTRARVAELAVAGELQAAVDAVFFGGALVQRAGGDPDVLIPLLGRLEDIFGEDAVGTALDGAWGGALA